MSRVVPLDLIDRNFNGSGLSVATPGIIWLQDPKVTAFIFLTCPDQVAVRFNSIKFHGVNCGDRERVSCLIRLELRDYPLSAFYPALAAEILDKIIPVKTSPFVSHLNNPGPDLLRFGLDCDRACSEKIRINLQLVS